MKNITFLFFGVLFLASCAPLYIPNSPMIFNHDEQGDVSVNFRQGSFSSNLQVAYAATDNFNIGLMGSSLYTGESTAFNVYYPGTSAQEINVIGGYYKKISSTNMIEFNAGAGAVYLKYPENITNYYNGFIQPTVTFGSRRDNTKFSCATRLKGCSFSEYDGRKDTAMFRGFFEPLLSFSTGDRMHFLMQAGISARLQPEVNYDYSPFIFNIGVGYTFKPSTKHKVVIAP